MCVPHIFLFFLYLFLYFTLLVLVHFREICFSGLQEPSFRHWKIKKNTVGSL